MIEAKGPGYEALYERAAQSTFLPSALFGLFDQALRQTEAAEGRPIIWFFAEPDAAEATRRWFGEADHGLDRVSVVYFPFPGSGK